MILISTSFFFPNCLGRKTLLESVGDLAFFQPDSYHSGRRYSKKDFYIIAFGSAPLAFPRKVLLFDKAYCKYEPECVLFGSYKENRSQIFDSFSQHLDCIESSHSLPFCLFDKDGMSIIALLAHIIFLIILFGKKPRPFLSPKKSLMGLDGKCIMKLKSLVHFRLLLANLPVVKTLFSWSSRILQKKTVHQVLMRKDVNYYEYQLRR